MRGALHKDHLQIDELDARRVRRHVAARGRSALDARGELGARGHRAGLQSRDAASRIRRRARLQSQGAAARPSPPTAMLDVAFDSLTGQLRGNAASGSGHVMRTRRGLDLRQAALPRRQHAASRSMAHRRLACARISTSASTPTTSRCSPRARAASCTPAASIGGTSEAPVIKLDAQGTGHRDRHPVDRQVRREHRRRLARPARLACGHRDHAADIRRARAHAVQRDARRHHRRSHSSRSDALAGKTSLHLSGKGGFADGAWNADHRRPVHRRHREPQPAARRAVRGHGEREGVQARGDVPARQGRAPVRRRRLERTAGWNLQGRCAQPADQHADRRTHAATSSTRARSTPRRR